MFSLVSVADLSAALRESADMLETGEVPEFGNIEWLALPDVAYPYSRFCSAFDNLGIIPYDVRQWYESKIEPVGFEQSGGVVDMYVLRLRADAADQIAGKVLARGRGIKCLGSG